MSRFVPVLVACSLLTTGCFTYVPIRPTELPKLNGSFQSSESVGANTTLVTRSVAQVEGEDGKMVELRGQHDVVVTLKDGTKTTYEHPVSASEQDGALVIKSGNLPEARIPLDSIQRVAIPKQNRAVAVVTLVGVGIVGALLLFKVVL
jgi:hypothetical protein